MKNFTPELIAKAKTAKSADELFALAKENGVEITADEAKTYFEQLNKNSAVSDDELNAVAGGGECFGGDKTPLTCGDKVRIPTCKKCSNKTGYVAFSVAMKGSFEIKCENCQRVVGTTADADKFLKI